jgi:predicted DCC family thiol-disulfide oxidoreductase YuxK
MAMYGERDIAGVLRLVDVSDATITLPQIVDREKAMSRLHVIAQDGRIFTGAAAFIEVWQHLRGWRWAAKIASLPGIPSILECAYCVFLKLRPALVQLFAAIQRLKIPG